MKTIRFIARSPLWRIRYMAAQKNGGRLFSRDVSDYSADMINLMYWSSFYASLSEMMPEDRPSDTLINDDTALDAFMEEYFKDQSRKDADARSKKKSGNVSAWNHDEMIVTKSNPVYEDISYSDTLAQKMKKRGNSDVNSATIEELHKKGGRF